MLLKRVHFCCLVALFIAFYFTSAFNVCLGHHHPVTSQPALAHSHQASSVQHHHSNDSPTVNGDNPFQQGKSNSDCSCSQRNDTTTQKLFALAPHTEFKDMVPDNSTISQFFTVDSLLSTSVIPRQFTQAPPQHIPLYLSNLTLLI